MYKPNWTDIPINKPQNIDYGSFKFDEYAAKERSTTLSNLEQRLDKELETYHRCRVEWTKKINDAVEKKQSLVRIFYNEGFEERLIENFMGILIKKNYQVAKSYNESKEYDDYAYVSVTRPCLAVQLNTTEPIKTCKLCKKIEENPLIRGFCSEKCMDSWDMDC